MLFSWFNMPSIVQKGGEMIRKDLDIENFWVLFLVLSKFWPLKECAHALIYSLCCISPLSPSFKARQVVP